LRAAAVDGTDEGDDGGAGDALFGLLGDGLVLAGPVIVQGAQHPGGQNVLDESLGLQAHLVIGRRS
jgi:hypothetical protein